jgi:hypothetical protein
VFKGGELIMSRERVRVHVSQLTDYSADKFAAREFSDDDPRTSATMAEMAYRRSPAGHLEAVANGNTTGSGQSQVVYRA